jgi:hypothetical protein
MTAPFHPERTPHEEYVEAMTGWLTCLEYAANGDTEALFDLEEVSRDVWDAAHDVGVSVWPD